MYLKKCKFLCEYDQKYVTIQSINVKKQIKAQMYIVILAKNINKTLYTT